MRSASDPHPRRARLCAVKSAVLLFFVLGATAWRLDGASFVIDFRQGSNQNPNLGQEVWINGILNTGNSEYFEGMVIPQRVIMLNVPATAGNVHHLTFHTDATKGGIHAFDFLASYPQTVETTNAIDPYFKTHPHMTAAGLNPCGPNIGPPNTMAATCAALRGVDNGSGYGANAVLIAPPSDPYVSKDGSTQSKINAFESAFPNGQLAIYGNAAVTNASITVVNHTTSGGTVAIANGTDTSDTTIHYDLTWTSASDEILFEFGAHLSVSGKDATGYNWGPGLGAAFISGGSYHVSLDALDAGTPTSISLGSQDNQIMANAVTLPPPSCGITGPDATCANTTGLTYSASSDGSSPTYVWSITGNGTINGSNTNSSVTVDAGSSGTFTISVSISDIGGSTSCSKTVTVNANPTPTATGGAACIGGSVTLTASSGFASYSWVGPSGFSSTAQNPTISNVSALNAGTYSVTVTDANGCSGSASATVVVNGNPVPTATGGSACAGGSVTLTASSGFASYSWVGPSGFTSTAQNPQLTNLQAANAGTYTVTVTDGNACTGSASTTVAVNDNPTPSATGGTACTGGSVTLTATGGFTTYSWVGPNSFTSTDQNPQLTNLTANDAGTYTVTVTDSNGCTGSASATVTVTACEEFCTVTPGFWGSAAGSQGKFDGITASNLLNCLMAGNPVVLGVYGIRSLTIDDPACVIERFPSSGTPTALPDFGKFGAPDRTISTATSCETTQPQIPLNNNGRFKNILLGETATLILNLRDDPALGGYVLPATISTVPANPGPDGIVGEPLTCVSSLTNDDSANFGIGCNTITRTVPAGLVGLTVNQLLTLANQALAGLTTGFTYSDINQAVTAINEGFDQCRFLGSCPSSTLTADPVPAEADR